jgi:hypothetical protein
MVSPVSSQTNGGGGSWSIKKILKGGVSKSVKKLLYLVLLTLPWMGLQWQKNSSGNFEAWDTSAKLKAEVEAGSEWAYTYV